MAIAFLTLEQFPIIFPCRRYDLNTKKKVLTSNISLDDPLMWGILPTRSFFSNRNSRWTLGARDILFTNPYVILRHIPIINTYYFSFRLYSTIFRNGKVIDTVRGVGKYQSAVDLATQRLDAGDWVRESAHNFVRKVFLTSSRFTYFRKALFDNKLSHHP